MRSPGRLRPIALGLVVSLGILLIVETVARAARTFELDATPEAVRAPEDWFVYSPTLGWERKPGYRGVSGLYERSFDSDGYFSVDSQQIADPTRRRVVFIGDSNTFGYGVPTSSAFVEVVDRLLPDISAINLGVTGYTSYQGRVALEKYLPIVKPDLVVASFNFNDRRYVLPPGTRDSAQQFETVYQSSLSVGPETPAWLERSYLFRAFRRAMIDLALAPALPSEIKEVRVDAVVPRVDLDAYRQNLTDMAEQTRRAGIPLVFLLLKDNPIESQHLTEGIAQLTTSADRAVAHLKTAMTSNAAFADLARLYLKQTYEAQGNSATAATVVVSRAPIMSLHGGGPVRLDTTYNEIMRQVAHEHGVELVDAGGLLDEHPGDYIDNCHFNVDGHQRVGELLAGRIAPRFSAEKAVQEASAQLHK